MYINIAGSTQLTEHASTHAARETGSIAYGAV